MKAVDHESRLVIKGLEAHEPSVASDLYSTAPICILKWVSFKTLEASKQSAKHSGAFFSLNVFVKKQAQ